MPEKHRQVKPVRIGKDGGRTRDGLITRHGDESRVGDDVGKDGGAAGDGVRHGCNVSDGNGWRGRQRARPGQCGSCGVVSRACRGS